MKRRKYHVGQVVYCLACESFVKIRKLEERGVEVNLWCGDECGSGSTHPYRNIRPLTAREKGKVLIP